MLVVHAVPEARREIATCLTAPGVVCREAASGAECLQLSQQHAPDQVILDPHLPDQSGLGVCRLLRETPRLERIPVVFVSEQASEIDRVLAFEAGADDFLARPYYAAELRARVDAVLRGFRTRSEPVPRSVRELVHLDPRTGRAQAGNERVQLTRKELELLSELMRSAGRVVRRKQLIERIWGEVAPRSARAVDAHVKSIRRKLGPAGRCIETVRGVGYRFAEPPSADPPGPAEDAATDS